MHIAYATHELIKLEGIVINLVRTKRTAFAWLPIVSSMQMNKKLIRSKSSVLDRMFTLKTGMNMHMVVPVVHSSAEYIKMFKYDIEIIVSMPTD